MLKRKTWGTTRGLAGIDFSSGRRWVSFCSPTLVLRSAGNEESGSDFDKWLGGLGDKQHQDQKWWERKSTEKKWWETDTMKKQRIEHSPPIESSSQSHAQAQIQEEKLREEETRLEKLEEKVRKLHERSETLKRQREEREKKDLEQAAKERQQQKKEEEPSLIKQKQEEKKEEPTLSKQKQEDKKEESTKDKAKEGLRKVLDAIKKDEAPPADEKKKIEARQEETRTPAQLPKLPSDVSKPKVEVVLPSARAKLEEVVEGSIKAVTSKPSTLSNVHLPAGLM